MTPKKRAYDYSPFGRPPGVPAEVAAAELARIRTNNKKLTASAVVQAAEPEDAPLHPAFKWDDAEAAHEFRLMQARQLIRAVRIVRDDKPPQRIYVHISERDEDEGAYEPISLVIKHSDRATLALIELRKRVASAQESLDEFRAALEASGDRDRMALVALAAEAMAAARAAVQALH